MKKISFIILGIMLVIGLVYVKEIAEPIKEILPIISQETEN